MKSVCVLSTKKLKSDQKQFLINSGFTILDEDFIQIQSRPFQIKKQPELLLFTSQNAVKSVLQNDAAGSLKKIPAVCVGSVTKKLLENQGFTVLATQEYASELAPIIQKQYKNKYLAFFAGNLRRAILPNALQQANIKYDEYLVYQNTEKSQKIDAETDAILFFSPSGVTSYLQLNTISKQTCFCIGTTTANALAGITENIVIAEQQNLDAVILQCINYYKR